MTDCYDIVFNILERIKDFNDLFYASQVCSLWHQIAKTLIPKLTDNPNIRIPFKITKIRFLLEKLSNLSYHQYTNCNLIIQGKNKVQKFNIIPIKEDDKYIIYESDVVPIPFKYIVLRWRIETQHHIDLDIESPYNFNTQVVPDDLSWQYFKTGNKYITDAEQVVIGSAGGFSKFHCCCGIQLLPY
jgi:hypothetical protein